MFIDFYWIEQNYGHKTAVFVFILYVLYNKTMQQCNRLHLASATIGVYVSVVGVDEKNIDYTTLDVPFSR